MTDCTQVPTVDEIYQAKKNITDLDTFTNSTADTFVDSDGVTKATLTGLINAIDWTPVGLFADGVTFNKITDFAIDGDGTQWIYIGTYPFTAIAGTVPSEPLYQVIHVVRDWVEKLDITPAVLDERDVRFQITDTKAAIRYGLNEAIPKDDEFNFFRGLPSQDAWGDPLNIGIGSASFGRNGASYAYLSTTFGHDCSAYGVASTVGGAGSTSGNPDDPNNSLFGYCAFAHGKNTQSKGRVAHSVGEQCVAGSDYSDASGFECVTGPADIAHPNYVASNGLYAIAKGRRANAFGDEAIAMGVAVTAYNGAQVYGSGINTGSPLINSTPKSMAFGRSVDVATVKIFQPSAPANGAYGKLGFNTNATPLDLIEAHVKAGDTVSYISDATSATQITFRLGGRIGGVNRGIFDIKYTHPNAGQPFGVTTLLQNEVQFAQVATDGSITLAKALDLPGAGLKVAGTRIVGGQVAAIANSVGGDEAAKINSILAALRSHGLIAT